MEDRTRSHRKLARKVKPGGVPQVPVVTEADVDEIGKDYDGESAEDGSLNEAVFFHANPGEYFKAYCTIAAPAEKGANGIDDGAYTQQREYEFGKVVQPLKHRMHAHATRNAQ
jgi:hypothetical protein